MPVSDYLAVFGRRWWLVVICMIAAIGGAAIAIRFQSPMYRASTRLEATVRADHAQLLAMERIVRQIAARVSTTTTAESVRDVLRIDGPADLLLEKVHAQAFPDTLQIQIDVDDTDRDQARRLATAFAEIVLERQAAQMAGAPDQERVTLTLVDRPLAVQTLWPQPRSALLAAGVLGLLAGAAFALVWDAFDTTIKSPRDVERFVGLSTVGVVPPDSFVGRAAGRGNAEDSPIRQASSDPKKRRDRSEP